MNFCFLFSKKEFSDVFNVNWYSSILDERSFLSGVDNSAAAVGVGALKSDT